MGFLAEVILTFAKNPILRASPLRDHSMGSHTFLYKKNVIIIVTYESASSSFTVVNRFKHCSAGPTTHGGPRLVQILIFF